MFCRPIRFHNRSYLGFDNSLKAFIVLAILFTFVAAGSAWATTGYPGEISNIAVQNQTPTTVDIVWETVHPSTSQVVLARDQNYAGERRIPVAPDPALVNHHKVTIDRLMPYDASENQGTYYFYVASVDVNNVTSTAPGPFDGGSGDPATYLLPLQTAAPNPTGKSNYVVYTYGPMDVYAGSDLYFGMKIAQLAGNHLNFYVRNVHGYNNGTDGVVQGVIGRTVKPLNPQTISVHLECYEYNPNNSDAYDQYFDSSKNMGECWNFQYHLITVRLRTGANTIPGIYSATVTLEENGLAVPTTYYFNVQVPPPAPVPHPSYATPIPGKDSWESNMIQYGHKFCDNRNYGASRDSLNAAGNFLTGWRNESDAWYYDGGRVYQEIATYTNDPSWNHCALTILDPYRQWLLANDAKMDVWAIFPYGMLMNYWRTGDNTNAGAIHLLETDSGSANYGGWVDPYAIREAAYIADVRIADELITGNRDRLLAKNIDKLLGHFDMLYNGQLGASHPFMVGLAMETAIHYYNMTVAEGRPDNRVPAMVKHALDALWRDYYVPATHTFRYTLADIGAAHDYIDLNNLVAPAYAWYWNLSGDPASLSRGDELFQHTLDDPENTIWTGKQFSQIYKWSFDYVRWRSGDSTSAVVKDNNPFSGPYSDTEPPIETRVAVGSITNNTATITWKTYENANSQVIYGPAGGYYPMTSAVYDSGQGTMSHTVTLSGLAAGTTYHYRVNSRDMAGNLASLADATFTTTGGISGGGGGTPNGGGTIRGGGPGSTGGGSTSGNEGASLSATGSGSTTGGATSSTGNSSLGGSQAVSSTGTSRTTPSKQLLMQ